MGENCGTCHYFSFKGLKWWCCHPKHNQRIKKWGFRCPEYFSRYAKERPPVEKIDMQKVFVHENA